MNQEGKTLTELMVVVAIIGMVATMAFPNYSVFNSRSQIHCTTEEIASELRLARQLAMTYRDRVRIVLPSWFIFSSISGCTDLGSPSLCQDSCRS